MEQWGDAAIGALPDHSNALIVVPPFTRVRTPPLAPHLLAAIAERAGQPCGVLYANILFASEIGLRLYSAITAMANRSLLGERVFAAAAYGVPPLGWETRVGRAVFENRRQLMGHDVSWAEYVDVEARAASWITALAGIIADRGFRIVGCTTQFEQTAASIALLNRIKRMRPETLTMLGGANCDGEMADGISALDTRIDYIFSGESDSTFPAFLQATERDDALPDRIIRGSPLQELDTLPTPSFAAYYAQLEATFPIAEHRDTLWRGIWVGAESSRGCWWGQRHHCTFCGLNGTGMGFREKSPDRILSELAQLVSEHPLETPQVQMTDNIMPHTFFRTLIPALIASPIGAELFYEQKANLSLTQVKALKDAGVASIQPGIEALSTPSLKRMKKGTTAGQNINLLRFASSVGLRIRWNLLSDFPDDEVAELEETYALLPLLRHLMPPPELGKVSIDRFSPYFDQPAHFGIRQVSPIPEYAEILPRGADVPRIAYFFRGDYDSATRDNPDLVAALGEEITTWREAWSRPGNAGPMLWLHPSPTGSAFVLMDTRGLPGARVMQVIDRDQASAVLIGPRHASEKAVAWALEEGFCVQVDGQTVPLAVADLAMWEALEADESPEATTTREADPHGSSREH